MAVRIDIRPRLTLRDEPLAPARRRFSLPPLALPATGYWLAMGALTYFFAHLGPSPLDVADTIDAPVDVPVPFSVPDPAPALPPAAAAAVTVPQRHVLQSETKPEAERPVATASEPERPREARAPSREREASPSIEPRAQRAEPAPRLQFPEFTDSSRPAGQERAADGPRIDSLFERRAERAEREPPAPTTAQADSEREAPATVSSCENAIARNNEQISIGGPRGPADITREAYAGILQNGGYLSGCSIPERTVFEICAAVRDGRAVGVTVTSSPASPSLNACVRRAVSRLKFPHNSRLDVTHTRFDALRR